MKHRAILLVIGIFLALCLVETGIRLWNPFGVRARGTSVHLVKNVCYRTTNDRLPGCDPVIVHTKNSLGFRGDDPPEDWNRCLKVVCIGGSTTECMFLSDNHDWPALLGNLMRHDFDQVWMNNAGLDGNSTFGHLILLKDVVFKLHPDLVILLIGMNDTSRTDLTSLELRLLEKRHRSLRTWIEEHSAIMALVAALRQKRAAEDRGLAHTPINVRDMPVAVTPPLFLATLVEQDEAALHGYGQRVRAILSQCRDQRIKVVLVTQPALYGEDGTIDASTGRDLGRVAVHEGISGRAKWAFLERYNDVVRQYAHDDYVQVSDLARNMPKDSRLFYDLIHFNNEGAKTVAELIYKDLKPYLIKNFPEHIRWR